MPMPVDTFMRQPWPHDDYNQPAADVLLYVKPVQCDDACLFEVVDDWRKASCSISTRNHHRPLR